jgi:hypothetical protein
MSRHFLFFGSIFANCSTASNLARLELLLEIQNSKYLVISSLKVKERIPLAFS